MYLSFFIQVSEMYCEMQLLEAGSNGLGDPYINIYREKIIVKGVATLDIQSLNRYKTMSFKQKTFHKHGEQSKLSFINKMRNINLKN